MSERKKKSTIQLSIEHNFSDENKKQLFHTLNLEKSQYLIPLISLMHPLWILYVS